MRLVGKYGTKKWPLVSEKLCLETRFERTGKQCRERYALKHVDGITTWTPRSTTAYGARRTSSGCSRRTRCTGTGGSAFPVCWKAGSCWWTQDGQLHQEPLLLDHPSLSPQDQQAPGREEQHPQDAQSQALRPLQNTRRQRYRPPHAELTETILHLGKIKPNKKNRELNPEHFSAFNEMITKLYQINRDYEELKTQKRAGIGRRERRQRRGQGTEGGDEREGEGEGEGEGEEE